MVLVQNMVLSFYNIQMPLKGKFGFILRHKYPNTLVEAHECATNIEDNFFTSKVEPFYAPHDKFETKPRTMNNFHPIQDVVTLLA
jgi:hypothetical protein